MNLIENEEFNEKKKKTKMIMSVIIVFIVLLLILSGVLLYMIYSVQKNTLKLNIDNKSTNFESGTFVIENDKLYINIKKFAILMGYETHNSEYKDKYSEDTTKCYISDSNENASYILNSNTIYKKATVNDDYEYFKLEEPVKYINNELYVTEEGMEIGTNCLIQYNSNNNLISVISLENIVNQYATKFTNSAIADDKADFNNRKALRYGLVVVQSTDNHYGVYNSRGQEIIGTKYKSIRFKEDSQEFTVTTDEGKMGILTSNGNTKIEPNYDEIKQISKDLNYYLVSNNKKYGVINENGKIVMYLKYEKIGVDVSKFSTNNIENSYILFDNCIPVQRNKKWGLLDVNGNQILPLEYDEMGCISGTQNDKSSNNVLIIPQYEAIVVGKDGKYSIVSSLGKIYIPNILDGVYSITNSGEEKYYMIVTRQVEENGKIVDKQESYDVAQYFEQKVTENKQEEQSNENTVVTNETVVDNNDSNTTQNDSTNIENANAINY